MSRNKKYEDKLIESGLRKVTVWLPESAVPQFKLAASLILERPELSLCVLRSSLTNKFVSIEHPSLMTPQNPQ